jgi:hypothetical protein
MILMRDYDIHKELDQELPSDEDVMKYKDFGKLTYNYQKVTRRPKKPFYRDPKAFLALVLLIVIVWLIFEEVDQQDKAQKDKKKEQKKELNEGK